ncbi:hypothetical protein VitviT2T_014176 [Vitis vinifera]|uniref:Chaperone protein dnaJ 8, chloroplastic n=2 Tax=Vitis vinifera TaxID=29760 RepID=F6HBS5_VITVI|nr:chaperone protein dnaJ 8, chloroplastic [Vitis vinifera]RVW49208.1 Chaperone protein dnaJ 8, chloroplastic [Vitis vinifera]WJZ95402.1 hypothetical protein VitviT2T_014176 [Vitis vinifera]|eukprot:XP_002263153.1 PREDICTED: chaperone protein dnaJ 8, chloroplastic [Vitis vinifera]
MAVSGVGEMIGAGGSSPWIQLRDRWSRKKANRSRVSRVSASLNLTDPYKTLRIQPGASESEVKKAFRRLALQYHPDVCRGSNCGVQFHLINEAYDTVMSNFREESTSTGEMLEEMDESMRGYDDPDWELWEEWMGWEGAGIRDYSSHINPYI